MIHLKTRILDIIQTSISKNLDDCAQRFKSFERCRGYISFTVNEQSQYGRLKAEHAKFIEHRESASTLGDVAADYVEMIKWSWRNRRMFDRMEDIVSWCDNVSDQLGVGVVLKTNP